MAWNLSSPKRSKNFAGLNVDDSWALCYLWDSQIGAVLNWTFLLKAPASHPNAMISSSAVTIACVRFSAPRRFQEFWWPGCRRSLIKVLSPGVCKPSFWYKIRLEVGYSQLPASKPSALINGSSVRMRNEKTQHINTVFWLSAAQSVSKFGNVLGTRSL